MILLMGLALGASAQRYSFTFKIDDCTDTMLYIGRHFRDVATPVDSARLKGGVYVFCGKRHWDRGVYALLRQDRRTQMGDFCIDESKKFTISGDAKLSAATVTVKGCKANAQMFDYIATEKAAKREMDDIRQRMKDPATKAQAEADEQALIARIEAYEATALNPQNPNIFFDLQAACDPREVPDSVEDKPTWYRHHYWDALFETISSTKGHALHTANNRHSTLLHSPQLFNKMNYYFFNVLYYADSDTISSDIDRLAQRIGDDTALLRYIFDFIEPRYFRSTRNVGWDAVWCHLAGEYYLKGRCPWASEGTLHNMRYNYERIRQSLIGAHGQELWMADTNQSSDPKDWISSHRFPTRYVILWFWDPDCHHCQEQSEELKKLYDEMVAKGEKRFEIYGVGYESDVEKWKKYVREHDFKWVNVGGTNVNIDYQEAYNVHGAPTMIILNERRDIIMNKVLPAKNLMQFLDNYEKRGNKETRR